MNEQNKFGFTPAHYAALTGQRELVALLQKFGADLTLKNGEGKTVEDMLEPARQTVYSSDD